MKLTIDRATWLHGEGGKASYLLRQTDQKRCCLGFLGSALGYSDACLLGMQTPRYISDFMPESIFTDPKAEQLLLKLMVTNDCKVGARLYGINVKVFDPELNCLLESEAQREALLTKLFAQHDIQVEFT